MVSRRVRGFGIAAFLGGIIIALSSPTRAEEPVCFECHDDFPSQMKKFAFTHDPAASGDCTACHLDHGDEEKLMLVKQGAELCYECHDSLDAGASVHTPVADGECTECHNPHGSGTRKMLVASGAELCAKCHDDKREFGRKVQHTALEDGCEGCHQPHNSQNPRLLAKNLLLDRIGMFEPGQAELCFECHDQQSFTELKSEDTGFRIGQNNLHALHLTGGSTPNKYGIIKKKDGQTCYACHLPHTADQDMLLRTDYQCTGVFCYTMRYTKNEKGGTCVVGCHKPRTYSRDGLDPRSTAGLSPAETPEKPIVR